MKRLPMLFIASAACLLLGCGSSTKRGDIDQSLLQPCPDLQQVPVADDGTAPMGDLMLADIDAAGMYRECQAGKNGLIEAIKKAGY